MTEREALKLALEALEVANSCVDGYYIPKGKTHLPEIELAITAIKEALAQPEQEPVAFVKGCNKGQWEIFPAKAYQIFEREQPLYTSPPQRPSRSDIKPLTDEEITDAVREADFDWHYGWTLDDEEPNRFTKFARAIEAAHGIKGEA